MKTIGNILWLVLCGLTSAIGWLIIAGILALSIVGLPFARQCLKLARFTLWPFGRTVVPSATAAPFGVVGAVLWFLPGLVIGVGYAVSGVALCLTVIGIPFGLQAFKFVPLALAPFGKEIIKSSELRNRMRLAAAASATPDAASTP